jgi:hypothetical protein
MKRASLVIYYFFKYLFFYNEPPRIGPASAWRLARIIA